MGRQAKMFSSLLLTVLLVSGCRQEQPAQIDLNQRQAVPAALAEKAAGLTVCVGAMITPHEGYGYYKQLIDYLAARLQVKITPIDPGNYTETNKMLETGHADFAFVCGGPYVSGHDTFGLELLAAPVVNGETVYYSYLIVPKDSPARSLTDLRGKTFAFTDPQSNSGKLVPTAMLARSGETPEHFFSSTTYTYGHDRSIQAVADRLVDGAAVDSLIWEYLAATRPALTAQTRIIARSEAFGIPPVVVSPRAAPELRERLRQVLLKVHEDPTGAKILKGMNIERFVTISDSAYDGIRNLESATKIVPPAKAAGTR